MQATIRISVGCGKEDNCILKRYIRSDLVGFIENKFVRMNYR
jgi:hypothetical protein